MRLSRATLIIKTSLRWSDCLFIYSQCILSAYVAKKNCELPSDVIRTILAVAYDMGGCGSPECIFVGANFAFAIDIPPM